MLSNLRHTSYIFKIGKNYWELKCIVTSKGTLVLRLISTIVCAKDIPAQSVLSSCAFYIDKLLKKYNICKIIFITTDNKWNSFFHSKRIQQKFHEFFGFTLKSYKEILSKKIKWVFISREDSAVNVFESSLTDNVFTCRLFKQNSVI